MNSFFFENPGWGKQRGSFFSRWHSDTRKTARLWSAQREKLEEPTDEQKREALTALKFFLPRESASARGESSGWRGISSGDVWAAESILVAEWFTAEDGGLEFGPKIKKNNKKNAIWKTLSQNCSGWRLAQATFARCVGPNLVGCSFSFCSERQKSAFLKQLTTYSKIHVYIRSGRQVSKTQIQSERRGIFTIGRRPRRRKSDWIS